MIQATPVMTQPSERLTHVLVVDDEPVALAVIKLRLEKRGYTVETASSGGEALERLERQAPDVALIDVAMPVMNGMELLSAMRARDDLAGIPVILISAQSEAEFVVEGLSRGANDYLSKPIAIDVLCARIEAQLRFQRMLHRVERQAHVLRELAAIDPLTQAFNRRSMDAALERELTLAARNRRPLTLVMFDVDHFKAVNDTYGHQAGDRVLQQLASRVRGLLRQSDQLCRYGGEEFCLLLPETSTEAALQVCERLITETGTTPFESDELQIRVTVSLGVAELPAGQVQTAEALLARADAALYAAKHSGRNRVCVLTMEDETALTAIVGPGEPS